MMRRDRPRKDGTCSVCIQSFKAGNRLIIPLDIWVKPESFSTDLQKIIYVKEGALSREKVADYNLVLNHLKTKVHDIQIRARLEDQDLSLDDFKKLIIETDSRGDFIAFFRKEIMLQRAHKKTLTIKSYNNTLIKLVKFNPSVAFKDLNYDFIDSLERWLLKLNLHINTRWKVHRNMKYIINQAIRRGIISKNPYVNFKAKSVQSERVFLTTDEVVKLVDIYSRPKTPERFKKVLQYFLFGCFTSLRISDLQRINWNNIAGDTLIFMPEKNNQSQKILKIPLTQIAQRFISNESGNLFDTFADAVSNRYLKEIADYAEIPKQITMHASRHTFAVMFLESGGKVEVLKEIMGHKDIKTTFVYVHIVDQQKQAGMSNMESYFNNKSQE
jgi:site-specific recombinase XerD